MSMESAPKRRRVQRSPSPTYKLDGEDAEFTPYIPVAQRRQAKLAKLTSWGGSNDKERVRQQQREQEEREDEEREDERRRDADLGYAACIADRRSKWRR